MPGYKTHDMIAYITVVPITTLLSYTLSLPMDQTIVFSGLYIVASYYLSPDLDTCSIMKQRWNGLYWFWIPYRTMIKHRSFLSHSGPVSACIRIAYMMLPLFLLEFLMNISLFSMAFQSHVFLLFCLSVILSDTVHTLTDYIGSFYARKRRSFLSATSR